MIKNKNWLLDCSAQVRKRRELLIKVADFVLEKLSPANLLKGKLTADELKNAEKIIVIGIGKAAKKMVEVAMPEIHAKAYAKKTKIFLADEGHPLPTKAGVLKTQKIVKAARSLTENDLAIVLLSGGGSAMLTAPARGISLKDKIKVTKELLKSGANIQEMNIVRKHLSQIKGGRLAKLLYPAKVMAFVISDVVGNDLSTISSGPLSPDKSTFSDALKVLKKYKIRTPANVYKYLEAGQKNPEMETSKSSEKFFKNVKIEIIADNSTVAKMAANKAKQLGLKCIVLKNPVIGEAKDEAKLFVKKARKKSLIIATGETTVSCRGSGWGGRNQEFALSALRYINPNQTVLSIGTDGVDGICPKDIAGVIADFEIIEKAKKNKLIIGDFLRNNDSYSFFKRCGGQIETGKTGTNIGDLMLLYSD